MLGYVDIQTPTPTHVVALGALLAIVVVFLLTLALPRLLEWMGVWRTRWMWGVCGKCGYSRRGLSGTICPECGADTTVVGEKVRLTHSWWRTLLLCAGWVGVVWLLGDWFRYDIERYWLRLRYGLDYSSKWRWAPSPGPGLEGRYWYYFVVWCAGVLGCGFILFFMRRAKQTNSAR